MTLEQPGSPPSPMRRREILTSSARLSSLLQKLWGSAASCYRREAPLSLGGAGHSWLMDPLSPSGLRRRIRRPHSLSLSLSLSSTRLLSPSLRVSSFSSPPPPPLTIVRLRIRPLPIWLSNQELLVTLAIVLPDEHGSFVSTTACNVKRGDDRERERGRGEDDEGSEDAYIRGITGAHRVIHCMETCNFVGLDIVSATTVSTMFFPPIRNSAAMKILNTLPATPR